MINRGIAGAIVLIGLAGVAYYGIRYLQDSETFSVLDTTVQVSTGDASPILASGAILVVGILLLMVNPSQKTR